MKRNSTTFIEFLGWVCASGAVLILLANIFLATLPEVGFIPPDFLSVVGIVQTVLLAAVFFWMAGIAKDLAAIRKALAGGPEETSSEESSTASQVEQ